MVKNPLDNAGDAGLIHRSGRSPGVGNSSFLAWKIPWTAESGGLQSMGSQRVRRVHTHTCTMLIAFIN